MAFPPRDQPVARVGRAPMTAGRDRPGPRERQSLAPRLPNIVADERSLRQIILNILSNADFPYPQVTLRDGRSAKVNHARYTELRASAVREDRLAVHTRRRHPIYGKGQLHSHAKVPKPCSRW